MAKQHKSTTPWGYLRSFAVILAYIYGITAPILLKRTASQSGCKGLIYQVAASPTVMLCPGFTPWIKSWLCGTKISVKYLVGFCLTGVYLRSTIAVVKLHAISCHHGLLANVIQIQIQIKKKNVLPQIHWYTKHKHTGILRQWGWRSKCLFVPLWGVRSTITSVMA